MKKKGKARHLGGQTGTEEETGVQTVGDQEWGHSERQADRHRWGVVHNYASGQVENRQCGREAGQVGGHRQAHRLPGMNPAS